MHVKLGVRPHCWVYAGNLLKQTYSSCWSLPLIMDFTLLNTFLVNSYTNTWPCPCTHRYTKDAISAGDEMSNLPLQAAALISRFQRSHTGRKVEHHGQQGMQRTLCAIMQHCLSALWMTSSGALGYPHDILLPLSLVGVNRQYSQTLWAAPNASTTPSAEERATRGARHRPRLRACPVWRSLCTSEGYQPGLCSTSCPARPGSPALLHLPHPLRISQCIFQGHPGLSKPHFPT